MSVEAKTQALASALADLITEIAGSGGASKPASKPAAGKKPAASSKKKEIMVDDLAEAFGKFLNTGNAAAKKKAKTAVQGIVAHFEAERVTKLDPDNFEEALDLLKQYQDGEDPLSLFEEEEDDESPI